MFGLQEYKECSKISTLSEKILENEGDKKRCLEKNIQGLNLYVNNG